MMDCPKRALQTECRVLGRWWTFVNIRLMCGLMHTFVEHYVVRLCGVYMF